MEPEITEAPIGQQTAHPLVIKSMIGCCDDICNDQVRSGAEWSTFSNERVKGCVTHPYLWLAFAYHKGIVQLQCEMHREREKKGDGRERKKDK